MCSIKLTGFSKVETLNGTTNAIQAVKTKNEHVMQKCVTFVLERKVLKQLHKFRTKRRLLETCVRKAKNTSGDCPW